MARNPTPDLAGALAAMKSQTGRGRGRKSEMYRWMDARHDALAAAFAKEPPSWTGLAKFFTEAGMLTADGLPQTAASVRSTWMRVTQTRARRAAVVGRLTVVDPAPEMTIADDAVVQPGAEPLPQTFTPIGAKK
jgi:hypothetical protein